MWTNENPTWEMIRILKEKKMMTSRIWEALKQRTSTAKFYYFTSRNGFQFFQNRVYTAQYVRNWMWVYEQFKNKLSNPNTNYMNVKYQVSVEDVEHPEGCKWAEVTGLNLDDMDSLSSQCDTFAYQSDAEPKVLREFPLTTFTQNKAELLY